MLLNGRVIQEIDRHKITVPSTRLAATFIVLSILAYFFLFHYLSQPSVHIDKIQDRIVQFDRSYQDFKSKALQENILFEDIGQWILKERNIPRKWNKNTFSELRTKDFIGIDHSLKNNGFQLVGFLPVIEKSDSSLSSFVYPNELKEYQFVFNEKGQHTLQFNDKNYSFEIKRFRPLAWKSILFCCMAFASLCFLLYSVIRLTQDRNRIWITPLIFIGLRLSLFFIIPYSALKNTTFFSSLNSFNFFNPSIGDFVLNALFLFFLAWFIYLRIKVTTKYSIGILILICLAINLLFIQFIEVAKGIVFNSGVNLNIEQVLSFDKYSILIIISLFVVLFSIFIISHKGIEALLYSVDNTQKKALIVGTSLLASLPIFYWCQLDLPVLLIYIFLIAYYILFDLFREKANPGLVWAIWWTMLFAGFLTSILFSYSLKKRTNERLETIETLYEHNSPTETKEIISFFNHFSKLPSTQQIASTDFPIALDKNDVLEFINKASNHTLLTEYFLSIEAYDGLGNSIFRKNYKSKNVLDKELLESQLIENDLYYNPFRKNYIRHISREDADYAQNRIDFYYSVQKKNTKPFKEDLNLNYAIYKQTDNLLKSNITSFGVDPKNYVSLNEGSYNIKGISVLVKEPFEGIKIISAERLANLIKPISLFSFIFCVFGLCIFLLTLLNTSFDFLGNDLNLKLQNASSLKGKIQMAFVLLIIFSFMLIGMVTVFYFNNVLKQNQSKQINTQIEAIKNDVENRLSDALGNTDSRVIVNNSLQALTDIHKADFSLYNNHGVLENSLDWYVDALLPHHLYNTLKSDPKNILVQQIEDGITESYIPLSQVNKAPYGYLKVKHRPSVIIQSRIIDFISTILNVYVFLFLLAGALALSIADSITKPLQGLAEKIKQLTIGKKNEKLEWKSRDEVGALIEEYNRMIIKIEESANVLARTERDMAWREMAKQVAHEIKNPLTPMKLNIQYLQRAIDADPEKAQGMIQRISHTLIEQIDNLSRIASEFSHFATMPQASNEKVVLNEIVEHVHDLFRKREDMDINMTEPIDDIFVFADKGQLIRVLTNLVKNAIQAIPDDRRGKIEIHLLKEGQQSIIRVKDNGQGIPERMREKVFQPNFTTKNSGTGLGLAISSNIIEALNGSIQFTSIPDEGTTFTIILPLMRLEENRDDKNRVVL